MHVTDVLPVHGTTVTIQQAGPSQEIAASTDAADCNTAFDQGLKSFQQRSFVNGLEIDASAQKQRIERFPARQVGDRLDFKAVTGDHRLPIDRKERKLVKGATTDAVGHTQWLNRGCKRNHGVLGQEQKAVTYRVTTSGRKRYPTKPGYRCRPLHSAGI